MSLPESPDQIKVMNKHELAGAVSLDDNPELEAIIFEGQECRGDAQGGGHCQYLQTHEKVRKQVRESEEEVQEPFGGVLLQSDHDIQAQGRAQRV